MLQKIHFGPGAHNNAKHNRTHKRASDATALLVVLSLGNATRCSKKWKNWAIPPLGDVARCRPPRSVSLNYFRLLLLIKWYWSNVNFANVPTAARLHVLRVLDTPHSFLCKLIVSQRPLSIVHGVVKTTTFCFTWSFLFVRVKFSSRLLYSWAFANLRNQRLQGTALPELDACMGANFVSSLQGKVAVAGCSTAEPLMNKSLSPKLQIRPKGAVVGRRSISTYFVFSA